jgi:sterol desaturase/sphingolipid hydroxylase (fatty acid hydroxylase superfamily)
METVLTLLIPITFLLFVVLERVRPARELPEVKRWLLKGFVFFVVSGAINGVIPAVAAAALGKYSFAGGAKLPLVLGAVVAFALGDLGAYWVHRGMHNSHFVWRWTHQMHHSAERLDMAGAVYFHPFDIALQAAPPAVAAVLLGLSPDAAALAGYIGFFYGMFQHLNVRTPVWLGYLIQRPEAHSVHHARGVHAYNYGNLPLWDLLFGTFRNPATFTAQAGFWDGASKRVAAMLAGRDVAEPPPRATEEAVVADAA